MNEEMANSITDSRDDQPEPPQEYPSHMVEEEEDATEEQAAAEEIMEEESSPTVQGIRQQLEDDATNRQAYENLTREHLGRIVEDVLGEADPEIVEDIFEAETETEPETEPVAEDPEPITVQDVRNIASALNPETPTVRRVDVSQIPPGVSVQDFVRHYRLTGTIITDSTAVPSSYQGTDTTDATWSSNPAANAEVTRLFNELLVERKEEKEEVKEEEKEPEKPPLTEEEIKRLKEERVLFHKIRLAGKREIHLNDMVIDKNDLIITFRNGSHSLYHTDVEGSRPIADLMNINRSRIRSNRRRGGSNIKSIATVLIFDKNMNRLIVSRDTQLDRRTRRDGTRIYSSQTSNQNEDGTANERSFVIIDKDVFVNSRGKVWKVRHRNHISYESIVRAKKMYINQFDQVERFMSLMKFNIEQVHPVEDYDIMYGFGGRERHLHGEFALLLKFRDVTISNSIEMKHHIGDIMIRSAGNQNFTSSGDIRAKLIGCLYGTRLTFTPEDAAKCYQHSHLTTGMGNFGAFCTGEGNYGSGQGYLNEYSIQEHIFRLQTFVSWESLEGGPHFRMETIRSHGNVVALETNILGTSRVVNSRYVQGLIAEINRLPDRFDTFAPCFTIINDKGSLKFVADYNMFFRTFIQLIGNDRIKRIHLDYGVAIYTYNSAENSFHRIDNLDVLDPLKVIKRAEVNMASLVPIYMNGKYHYPHLSTREVVDQLEGMTFSPEPNTMKEIAQYIMYHLTSKLEEYGNSSES
jgi:hypothetical protein